MARIKLLIITNHFYPEDFKVNDVAFELVKKNIDVTVLTGIPNYPKGIFFEGYGLFKRNNEIVNNVKVIRAPLIPRGDGRAIRLILNYFSYTLFLSIWTFFLSFKNKYDKILVHHTSPIFLALPAIFLKKTQKSKLYFWNLDLWPDSLTAAGDINNKTIIKVLDKLVNYIYKNSDLILISSLGFLESLKKKNIPENKITYFPNWAEDIYTNDKFFIDKSLPFNKKENIFYIMFAGNIGEAQDIDSLLKSIRLVKKYTKEVRWLFLGEGRKYNYLRTTIEKENLEEFVILLGRKPLDTMPIYFKLADAMIVSLKDEYIFSLTAPAKIQAYMASKKIILGMISGEGARIIKVSNSGFSCEAGDFVSFAEIIKKFIKLNKKEICQYGLNGFNYYQKYFAKEIRISQIFEIINK